MAKPEKIRITLNEKNKVETVEVQLKGKWVKASPSECKGSVAKDTDAVIRVGQVAEPNSCVQDDRCPAPSNLCSIWIDGCYTYSC